MWHSSHGDWGLTIVQSHHTQRTCRTYLYLPSGYFRFNGRLLSPCRFPLRVSRCSGGVLLSTSPVSYRNSICTDAAHHDIP